MSDLAAKVPQTAIVTAFAGVMAISPKLYKEKLRVLAEQHGVTCNESFEKYVSDVLKKQPSVDFD